MVKNKKTNIMATIFMFLFLLAFLVISGRFIYIQVTGKASDVSLLDWANEKRSASIVLQSERGKIYDHNGMLLAYNRPTYRIYAILDEEYSENQSDPQHVTDTQETAKTLAPYLDMDAKEIKKVLDKGKKDDKFQVEFGAVGKNMPQETMEEIQELQIPGIYFLEDSIRYYPNGVFASHIIGFASNDEENEEEISGVTGMEQEQDAILKGSDGYVHYQRDKYNKRLLNADEVVKEPENGNDIYLTIDQKIQTSLEDVMSQVDDEYAPKRITAVVMNPKTGAVVAMSNRPSYNPNDPDQVENWYNDVVSTPVEAGSTTKIFTWAAAIDADVYSEDETYKSGKYKINEKVETVNDHNKGAGWGEITFNEGFRRSSNVAASKLVWEKIGTDSFYEYLEAFDLDKPTGIDLPSEVTGRILYDYPSDKLRAAFGQGSTTTPIQQIKAASAVVNDGKMVKPYVVDKIVDPDTNEIVEESKPEIVGQPIKKETASQMMELLDSVVNTKDGTGKKFRLEDYSAAGKTGTAQMPDPNGGYMVGKENYIFSFLGLAPKDDPKLMMHVSITQPKLDDDESGSDPVAFIFKNVMENGLHYLNIEPDKEKEIESVDTITFPSVIEQDIEEAKKQLKKRGINPTIIGKGNKITATNLEEGDTFFQGQRVMLITDKPTMPDLNGWSHRDVVTLGNLLDLDIHISGSGFVVEQSIKQGVKVEEKDTLNVELEPPELEE